MHQSNISCRLLIPNCRRWRADAITAQIKTEGGVTRLSGVAGKITGPEVTQDSEAVTDPVISLTVTPTVQVTTGAHSINILVLIIFLSSRILSMTSSE